MPKWSQESIAWEIRRAHAAGEDLSYSGVAKNNQALLRAAARHFGGWEAAVTFAGLCYDDLRRYRAWTNARIVARIGDLHGRGADLSWRQVSVKTDPGLAAAAIRPGHFGSWRAALSAAGLDYDRIRRYRQWSREGVLSAVRARHARGQAMNVAALEQGETALLTAARRRFRSWARALVAAGVDDEPRRAAAATPSARRTFARRPALHGASYRASYRVCSRSASVPEPNGRARR